MPHPIRFQVLILPTGSWKDVLQRFHHAEALGFDLAVTADHFVDWTDPPAPWFELWTLLAAVAQTTERIRIAPCVAQIPMRDPATCARQALSLDHISNGRIEVGLGLGLPIDPSYEMMGIENWSNKARAARFPEYVRIVDQLLSNEVTTFEGKYYQVNGVYMNPRPVQAPRPPITIAAMGPRMLRYTAELADTWNSMSFAKSFDEQMAETKARVAKITADCESLGREPDSLRMSYNMFDPDGRASGGRFSYYESPEIFEDMARHILDLGMTEIGLYYPSVPDQVPVFEQIAREVIPRLRQ